MYRPKLDTTKYRWRYIKLTIENCEMLDNIKKEGVAIYRFVNKALIEYAKQQKLID